MAFFDVRVALTVLSLLHVLQVTSSQMLEPFSTLYLPSRYDNAGNPEYEYGGDAIEDAAYDMENNLVYTAGDAFINIVDVSGIKYPEILHQQGVQADTPVVEICGDYVAFLSKNPAIDYGDGTVSVYKKYDRTKPGVFDKVNIITVGPEPESIAFTQDCRIAVVANAGSPGADVSGRDIVDPEGSVSIIGFRNGDMSIEPQNNTHVTFASFNNRSEEYVARGVRFVYHGQLSPWGTPPTLFSQDMTPEYVVLNSQGTKAYVSLQINNAIAVVDIASRSVDEIYPLGSKYWKNLDMDVSDQDGGIKFDKWPIKTLYQPDEIQYFETDGRGYIITANEGDPFKVKITSPHLEWTDVKLGSEFTDAELSPSLYSIVRNALNDSAKLGSHEFSTLDGFDEFGRIKYLHGFGGRGISVFRVSDFQQVYDSGDSVAKLHAQTYPDVFNADDEPDNLTPRQLMDKRSPKEGIDCESLAMGEVNGVRLIFVGADRSGTLMIFSLKKNSFEPQLEYVYRNGSTNLPISQLFANRDLNDAAPEALTFIPAGNKNSAGRFPMLMVAGTESGTLSFYKINYTGRNGAAGTMSFVTHFSFVAMLSVLTFIIM